MSTINVLIAINAKLIAENIRDGKLGKGTLDKPTNLGVSYSDADFYISMISPWNTVSNYQGRSNLIIKANSGDLIQWNTTAFDNSDYSAFLIPNKIKFVTRAPNSNVKAIGNPEGNNSEIKVYLPDDNGKVSAYKNNVYWVTTMIEKVGVTIDYYPVFELLNNQNGTSLGYFNWDPTIEVS